MDGAVAEVGSRLGRGPMVRPLTNFYPRYGEANDQVDRIEPVRRAQFQRVIPRYRLSTSETRDQGLGPQFVEGGAYIGLSSDGRERVTLQDRVTRVDGEAWAAGSPGSSGSVGSPRPAPLPDYAGRNIDLFA